jgi:hypothetical protein
MAMSARISQAVSRPLTWLIAGSIVTLAIVAAVDALSASSSAPKGVVTNRFHAPLPAPAASSERLPICTTPQLELAIEILGGSAAVALRHVSGAPCHLRRLWLKMWLRDRAGHNVRLVAGHIGEALTGSPFRGDFSPGFEQLRNVTFLPPCTPETAPRGPFSLSARAGPYDAQRRFSGKVIGCFAGG